MTQSFNRRQSAEGGAPAAIDRSTDVLPTTENC